MNITEIAKGFINSTKAEFGLGDEKVEQLANERYKVCLQCDTINEAQTYCSKVNGGCGCKLAWKTRSDSKCPKNNWIE